MKYKACASLALLLTATGASAAQIVTQTRHNGMIVTQTHTYANSSGDLRIDEHGPKAQAVSSSATASAGSIKAPAFKAGDIRESTIYQSRGKAIVSLEGQTCRKLTADTKPPDMFGGMMGGNADLNKQMAEAMKQANAAMEQAMADARREGMTREQEEAMRKFTQPFMEAPASTGAMKHKVRKLGESVRVAGYRGEGYEVLDHRGNAVQRLWMTPTSKLRGAGDVRNAMQGMMNTYREFLDKMGAGAVMDTAMIAVFENDELADQYPVRIEDLESGEVTDVIEVTSGDADYYPECEEKNMFGM